MQPATEGGAPPCAYAPLLASPRRVRCWAATVLAACLGILAVAVLLAPKGRAYGTHADLFLTGPCGMLVMTGLPCPTCGMTTSFAYFVRGQWLRAAYVQPAGFLLALGTVATAFMAGWTLVRGRWPVLGLWRISPYRLFLGLLVILLGGWVFKIVTGLADGSLPYPGGHGG